MSVSPYHHRHISLLALILAFSIIKISQGQECFFNDTENDLFRDCTSCNFNGGIIFDCNNPAPNAACFQSQCENTPECRWIPPIDTPAGTGGICERRGSCRSLCTSCTSEGQCAVTCDWTDDGTFDPSECFGSVCSTNCRLCLNQTRCEAAEVEPDGCIWTGTQCIEPTESPTMDPTFEPTTDQPTFQPTTDQPTEVTSDPTSDPTTEPTIVVADDAMISSTPIDFEDDGVDGGDGNGDDPDEIGDDGTDGASDDSPAGFIVRDGSSVSGSRSESESSSNDNGIFFRRKDDGNDVAFLDDRQGNTDNDLEVHVGLSPRTWSVVWGFIICCNLIVCLYGNIRCKWCDKKEGNKNRVFDVSMTNDV